MTHGRHTGAAEPAPVRWPVAAPATAHCLAGCAIGEVLGMVIGTAARLPSTVLHAGQI